jgi:hypothetical protein
VGVQDVRWEGEGYQTADKWKRELLITREGFFVEFVSDRMWYITLKGR